MKLSEVLKTFFNFGLVGFDVSIHVWRNPQAFRNEEPEKLTDYSSMYVPDKYLDMHCQQVDFDMKKGYIDFYVSENDEEY